MEKNYHVKISIDLVYLPKPIPAYKHQILNKYVLFVGLMFHRYELQFNRIQITNPKLGYNYKNI